jgi:hypothetical protein
MDFLQGVQKSGTRKQTKTMFTAGFQRIVNRGIEEQTEVNVRRQQQHFKCRCKKRPHLHYMKDEYGRKASRQEATTKKPNRPTLRQMRHKNAPVRLYPVYIFPLSKRVCFALEIKLGARPPSPAQTDISGTSERERKEERDRERERET